MKHTFGILVFASSIAMLSPLKAQFEELPTITTTNVERTVVVFVDTEGNISEHVKKDNMEVGPFVEDISANMNGNQGSHAYSNASQDTDITSTSISGSGRVEVDAALGGGEEPDVDASAGSNLHVEFTIPVDAPFSLSGKLAAISADGDICLASATIGFTGLDVDGQFFSHSLTFDCNSPAEDAYFLFIGTVQANAPLTLAFQVDAGAHGPGDIDELGTGMAQVDFVLDFGDRDGDGLLDSWEENGIDFAGTGIEIDLPGMGADPDKKDIFVELDVMEGVGFDQQAIDDVILAFSNAPADMIGNPNDAPGIQLHVVVDGDRPALTPIVLGTEDRFSEFYPIKKAFFGSENDRNHPGKDDIRRARLMIFRYCLWADTVFNPQQGHQFGAAEATPSNDFIVAAGRIRLEHADFLTDRLAGTFMHELGHTLGLKHGGQDKKNNKPNYLSVMNYAYTMPFNFTTREGTSVADYWELDYSRATMRSLNEASLHETPGLSGRDGRMVYFNGAAESDPEPVNRVIARAFTPWINWNGKDPKDEGPYFQDLTRNDASEPLNYDTHLESFTDWDRLWYHLPDLPDTETWPSASNSEGIDEATIKAFFDVEWIDLTVLEDAADVLIKDGFESVP